MPSEQPQPQGQGDQSTPSPKSKGEKVLENYLEKNPAKPSKPNSKRRRITPKAKKVLSTYIENPDATVKEISEKSGVAFTTARKILRRESVQEIMRDLMEKTPGLRHGDLLEKLREGLNATQKQRFAFEGRVRTEKEDADFRARGFYLSLACDIIGAKSQKVELTGANGAPLIPTTLTSALEAMDEETLKVLIKKLMAE